MRKGITPIIAVMILLLITVALAGTAWSYLSGFLSIQTSKSFEIPSAGAGAYCQSLPGDCDSVTAGVQSCNEFVVLVTNTGSDVLKIDDFVIREVDGKTKVPLDIDPGAATALTHNFPPDGIKTNQGATALRFICLAANNNCSTYVASVPATGTSIQGLHNIRIGTSSVTKTVQVSCSG